MKKLTKMGIDALRETLPVLSEEEQRNYMGMYAGDCFWRCVAFLHCGDCSDERTDGLAYNYFTEQLGVPAGEAQLAISSYVSWGEAQSYMTEHTPPRRNNETILYLDPNNIASLSGIYPGHDHPNSQSGHYVVLINQLSEDGFQLAHDPTNGLTFTMSAQEIASSMVIG